AAPVAPWVSVEARSLGDKQRQLQRVLENQGQRRVIQKLTQIGGVERYKAKLRQPHAAALYLVSLSLYGSRRLRHIFGATIKMLRVHQGPRGHEHRGDLSVVGTGSRS